MRSILPCYLPYGKAGGLQILCCQGIKVTDYDFTLDALALKPSDFCNVRVNIQDIDKIAVPSMLPDNDNVIVVVDEIGKMECFSGLFRQTLMNILEATNTVVGSISLKGNAFIGAIKKRPDALLISVSEKNRDCLVDEFFNESALYTQNRKG
jgi:nucleoside-triphosphatase